MIEAAAAIAVSFSIVLIQKRFIRQEAQQH
jgi:hypothetical protein